MKRFLLLTALCTLFLSMSAQTSDSLVIRNIYNDILVSGRGYEWLRELTSTIGGRLSGSPEAARAVEWARKTMMEAGADTVYLQPVMVPHWVRGAKEKGVIIDKSGTRQEVPVCALGGSVSTPKGGLVAPVVEVNSLEELEQLGRERIAGKIVFFNVPFDERFITTFNAYGEVGKYRYRGASWAAQQGAVGSIVRSMTNSKDDFPHTGAQRYMDSIPQIPCCAISTNGADLLSRILRSDKSTRFELTMSCQTLDSVLSYNVVGEIRGSQFPNEIITVGGHLDSWDTGDGAHDDGAGVVQSIEMLRVFKSLGMKPRRTVRAVAFMNEENGGMGGDKYAELAKANKEKHIAAMESDAGGFAPYGFGLDMPEVLKPGIRRWQPLFRPYNIWNFEEEHGGADIHALKETMNTPLMGLVVESQRYFDVHHAPTDTFDRVNKRELLLGAAAMSAMAYLLSVYGL